MSFKVEIITLPTQWCCWLTDWPVLCPQCSIRAERLASIKSKAYGQAAEVCSSCYTFCIDFIFINISFKYVTSEYVCYVQHIPYKSYGCKTLESSCDSVCVLRPPSHVVIVRWRWISPVARLDPPTHQAPPGLLNHHSKPEPMRMYISQVNTSYMLSHGMEGDGFGWYLSISTNTIKSFAFYFFTSGSCALCSSSDPHKTQLEWSLFQSFSKINKHYQADWRKVGSFVLLERCVKSAFTDWNSLLLRWRVARSHDDHSDQSSHQSGLCSWRYSQQSHIWNVPYSHTLDIVCCSLSFLYVNMQHEHEA